MSRLKVLHACEICGKDFYPWNNTTGRYCSRRCAWEGRGGAEFNARTARATTAQRAEAMRGRGEGRGYRKFNGRHEHRVVAEQKLGRALQPGEVVHHVNGDKLDNRPENLQVITQSEHIRIHKPTRGAPWKTEKAA